MQVFLNPTPTPEWNTCIIIHSDYDVMKPNEENIIMHHVHINQGFIYLLPKKLKIILICIVDDI